MSLPMALLIPVSICLIQGASSGPSTIDYFRGDWSSTNESSFPVRIPKAGDLAELIVEPNQIMVRVRLVPSLHVIGEVDVFLVEPLDLGRGGSSLPWENMYKTTPIARLSKCPARKNVLIFKWFGLRTIEMQNQNTVYQYGLNLQGEYHRVN